MRLPARDGARGRSGNPRLEVCGSCGGGGKRRRRAPLIGRSRRAARRLLAPRLRGEHHGHGGMVAYNLMLAIFPFALLILFVFGQIVQLDRSSRASSTTSRGSSRRPSRHPAVAIDRIRDSSTDDRRRRGRRRDLDRRLVLGRDGHRLLPDLPRRMPQLARAEALLAGHALRGPASSSPRASPCRRSRACSSPGPTTCRGGSRLRPACASSSLIGGGLLISFGIVCLIYWAVPKGHMPWRAVWPGALFFAIAGGIDNSSSRSTCQRLDDRRFGRTDRLRPGRAGLVLRGRARTARRRGDQLAAPRAATTRALPVNGLPSGEMTARHRSTPAPSHAGGHTPELRLLPDPDGGRPHRAPDPRRSPLRSTPVQPAQRPSSPSRRAPSRQLEAGVPRAPRPRLLALPARISLGLLKSATAPTGRTVVLLAPARAAAPLPAPEYDAGPGFGRVTWPIERGVLVARQGAAAATCASTCAGSSPSWAGRARVRIRAEVANFYPFLAARRRFARIGSCFYAQTQLRIHVLVTRGFLRSLDRLTCHRRRGARGAPRLGDATRPAQPSARPLRSPPASPRPAASARGRTAPSPTGP